MAITVTMLFPTEPDSRFDWDYFLNSHVPMVEAALAGDNLIQIKVALGLSGTAPGDAPAYQAVMIVSYDSIVAFHRTWRQHHHRIMADVTNFTNTRPVVQLSEDISSLCAVADAE